MTCIGEQGKGVGYNTANDFSDQKDKVDKQRPPEALIGGEEYEVVVIAVGQGGKAMSIDAAVAAGASSTVTL